MTGLICAMEKELALVRASFDESRVLGRLSGIGKVNAALAAESLIAAGADVLVNIGVAGALAPDLKGGDVVICTETAYHDVWCGEPNLPGQVQGLPPRFAGDGRMLSVAEGLLPPARRGLCVSGDRFITDPSDLAALRKSFPDALCVEMEAAAAAQVCHLRGIPFLAVKIISDSGDERSESYARFWETLAERAFALVKPLLEAL